MSANCNYSKKFLPLIKWHWDAVNRNVDAFKAWLSENFLDDPNTLYNQLAGSLGVTVERTSNIGSKKLDRPMIQGRMTLDETKTSYKDAFVGRTDLLIALEQRFKTDVVSKSVFDINNNVFIEASMIDTTSGLTVLNKNIVGYKQSLINALYNIIGSESINLSYDMSANDFQRAINQTLADYQTWKNSHPGDLKGIQEYTILSKFDEMLEKLAPFVAPKNEALLDSPSRYEYKGPTVKHYTNYGERNASIESQTSDLARILLSVLPEVELIKDEKNGTWREQVVDGSFIGLSGFNASMMALKQEILFGSKLNPELSQQYYNGANIDLGKLISAYLTILQGNKQSSNAAYFDMRQTFLLSKLRGLNRFIFNNKDLANSEMGKLLLDDMKSMFFKTEAVSYRGYAYDNELGKLIGRNLRSNFISTQKFQLADAIRGAVNFLKNDLTEQEALRKKYNIKVTGGSVSFSNGNENLIIMVNGNLKKNNHSFTYHGNASNIFVEELVGDVMQYIIPDNYYRVGSQMESDFNFIKDWAPLLAITVLGIYNDNTIPTEKGLVNLSGYNNYLLKAAKKLSVIYGAETTNVIKNPNGDKIPLFQLTNLTYNTKQLLYNLKKDRNAVNSDCIFLNNPELLVAPQVRSQVKIGNVVKDPAKLSVKELLHLGVIEDFYEPLLENLNVDSTESIVYLQNATFADKSTHYLIGYDVSKLVLPSRKTLKTILREILDGQSSKELEDYIRNIRKLRINKLTKKLISDYKTVFLTDGVIRPDIDQTELIKVHPNFVMNSLEDIDEFLKYAKYKGSNLTIRTLTDLFVDRGVQFDEEIYAYAPKNKALGKSRVNETIMNWYHIFNSPKLFEERLNKSRQQFINNLQNNRVEWNKHDSPTFATIAQRYSNWTDSVTGNIILSKDGKLHPVLEAYFLSDVLLSNEYNTVTIGEIWAHPNKNKRLTNDNPEVGEVGTYEEFSEANRLIAQIKRSVAFGATWHPFTQNLFNGVAPTINVAVMSDVKTVVPTPNGTSDGVAEVDSMDGSGYAHPLQSRFENNSLLSAGVGVNKKTIMMDVDYRTNKPILLKWAVYAINNAIRRIGTNSAIDAENLYMKMSNKLLNKKVDLHEAFISYGKPIYFYSNETGEYFKIKDITSGIINGVMLADRLLVKVDPYTGEEITEEYWESDLNGEEGRQMPINTLYDIDQLFGGAWTCDWNAETKQFDWNEANLDALEYLLSKKENQDLKDKFIGYAVNKSAIKVGAGNVNPDTAWSDDSELYTIPMNTKYGGIQMDFDHDLDDADVTEMTQMLSSLVENGYYLGIVGSIYEDIGKIAAKHIEKLSGPITVLDSPETTAIDKQDAKSRLYTELGKALFRAFKENNRDTLGLAQSFLELAKRAIKENNLDYKIPFSAATINGIFVSDVIADINRGGIRHKYSGFAGVLNPSYNVIQTYRIFNPTTGKYEVRMYKELCDFARKNGLQSMRDLKSIFVNDNLNPLMREVTDINTIEFEDTVVIFRPDRKVEGPYYINNFTKFDDLKLRLRANPNLRVFVHQGYGRNLRGAETRFIVNGKTYSIYDLDSVRASQYIVYLMDKKPLIAEQSALVTKVLGAGWEADLNTSLSRARAITQSQLKSAEEQGIIANSEAFQLGDENMAVPIEGIYTRPAEIVTGRYQGEKFGLNQHDHIWQIQDASFFESKINDKFKYPTNVPSDLYDVVLFEGDNQWLVKIGPEEVSSKVMSEIGNIYDNPDITYNNDDVVYNDNVLINKEGFKFKEYKDENGNRYNVVFAENTERYRQLLKSGLFNKNMELFNITDANLNILKLIRFGNNPTTSYINNAGQELTFDVNLLSRGQFEDIEIRNHEVFKARQAQRMYEAFKKQLMYVAARIPTQAMQSFMPEEIIAYADVDTALCFVSASQTMLEGSDYDADKSFMMTYGISDNGYLDMGEDNVEDFYGDQLRNRVVDRIIDITLRPQNQLIAQIPINMTAQQNAAAASALGRSELHINSDNPETKYMMQVQNMVGKEVIGISAVSLKAFFALSYYYGTLLEDLKQKCLTFDQSNIESCNDLIKSFRKLLIYNPINQEFTSLANINIQSVLDIIGIDSKFENIPFTNDGNNEANNKLLEWSNGVMFSMDLRQDVAFINLRQALNDLLIRVSREDAALADSGLISAATDNAKELILAKINATPELVDIYTYLLSIGTPFKAIADIMSSRAFNAITKIGESNIFDESTHGFKVKDMIGFYTGDDVPNAIKFGLKLGYIPSNEQADKAIEQLNSDIHTQEKRGGEHKDYIINEKRNAIKLYELIKFRNDSWNSLTEQEKAVVEQIYSILPAVEEMSNLGRILGINQGQPTKIYELGNMKKMIPNFMNTRGLELNFDQFLINPEYQQAMINAYEGIKLSYNILDVLATVPHFREMLKTLYYSERAIRLFSARNNTIIKLRDELEENLDYRNEKTSNKKNDPGKIALSKIDFQALDKYINDRLITGFLLGSGLTINVPDGAKRYNSYTDTPNHTFDGKTLALNDDLDIATFKYIMDKFIIKELKKKYAGNAFFDNLRPLADPDRTENVATGWKLSLQMMNIDASPNTQSIYSEILNGLDEVAGNTEYGQTIGDLFYIYNMIVNKDAFGQSSMTRVFENLLLRGTSKYINMYSQYISHIDDAGHIEYDVSEARYRILKANPNSRVKLTGLEKEQLNTKSELGPDFTLDVPVTGKQRNGNIVNMDTFKALEQAKEIGEEEMLDAIIDNINNNAGEEIAFIVDDDEIRDEFENDPELNKMLNSRGFVKNGSIYIRHESWLDKGVYLEDIPVLMHEYAHLVLASIKYGSNAQIYYKLLAKVQNDPMFEKYASKYPTAVGSDLMEEVFVSMIEDYLSNRPIKGIDMDEFSDCILTGIREMLQLDIAPELKDLVNQPLKGVIKSFASGLFNIETLIDKQQMMNNAKVRALKERLFTDGFLKQEC